MISMLASAYAKDRLSSEDLARHGFLVSDYSSGDYSRFLDAANHFIVVEDSNVVVGFLLGFDSESTCAEASYLDPIRERGTSRFGYARQIAVDRARSGQGLGGALYRHLFDRLPTVPIFASLLLEPRNVRSIAFHQKSGFREDFEVVGADGARRAYLRREPGFGKRIVGPVDRLPVASGRVAAFACLVQVPGGLQGSSRVSQRSPRRRRGRVRTRQ